MAVSDKIVNTTPIGKQNLIEFLQHWIDVERIG